MKATKLKVTQIRSVAGRPEAQREILRGLGLRRLHASVLVQNTPSFRGMIKKVIHLVGIEEVHG
jgi:large subunit ribosomal protein L30